MTIGSSSLWLKNLKDIDLELMRCVERVWPTVISKLAQTEREDKITERLVDLLRKDRGVCALGFLCIHFKLRAEDRLGDFTTKGILDMALFLDQDHERYIAYECKRLNIVNDNGRRTGSLAGPYVEEGVARYATAKYSEKLPYGGMLGYVMDGDLAFSVNKLKAAIIKRKTLVKLLSEEMDLSSNPFLEFQTMHERPFSKTPIFVRHRLLSIIS